MCTVTIIPLNRYPAADGRAAGSGGLVRMACNRDESRRRPVALPPVVRVCGPRRAIMPLDPVSDGTWVSVNDAGLAATLLNVYERPARGVPADSTLLSRGGIIPRLMACANFDDAVLAAGQIDPQRYPPFRLVIVDERQIAQFMCDGRTLGEERERLDDEPHLFTSSGLGDAVVERPRRALFEEMFAAGADWAASQDAYHRHAWPERRELSVCMERAEARTVSHTVVEIEPVRVRMIYVPEAPDRAAPLPAVELERTASN